MLRSCFRKEGDLQAIYMIFELMQYIPSGMLIMVSPCPQISSSQFCYISNYVWNLTKILVFLPSLFTEFGKQHFFRGFHRGYLSLNR